MGMRPTIGICFDGHIIDIIFCKNYGLSSLLIAAFKVYEQYKDCKNTREFKEKRLKEIREKNPDFVPYEETDEELRMWINASEFPLNVDFTEKCIYYGYYTRTKEELLKRPDSRTMMSRLSIRQQHNFSIEHFYNFVQRSVFRLDELDVEEILRLSENAGSFYQYYW